MPNGIISGSRVNRSSMITLQGLATALQGLTTALQGLTTALQGLTEVQ